MRFLILAAQGDTGATRVHAALQARHGPDAVVLASGEALALAPLWAHRLKPTGAMDTDLRLADGTRLPSSDIAVVLNRLRFVALPHWAAARPVDRDYATMEMHALLLSWLASLPCPVLNPPSARGLAGAERPLAEWLLLAGEAGLPARAYHGTTKPAGQGVFLEPVAPVPPCRVLVAGDAVVGNALALLPPDGAERCRRLAQRSGCPLLECLFAPAASGGSTTDWRFCGANLLPDLADTAALSAVVALLEERAARGTAG